MPTDPITLLLVALCVLLAVALVTLLSWSGIGSFDDQDYTVFSVLTLAVLGLFGYIGIVYSVLTYG